MIPALALAAALALGADPHRPPPPPPPPPRQEATRPPAPLSAEDADVVANLELLQRLELLQDLPIVDTGGKDGEEDEDAGARSGDR